MTHGDLPNWVPYVVTAAVLALLNVLWRFAGRRIGRLVHRCVPERFDFARRPLVVILAVISSIAIMFVVLLVALLAVYAVESI